MANVGTPRFYVCILSYLKAMDNLKVAIDSTTGNPYTANFVSDEDLLNLVGINPSNTIALDRNPDNMTTGGDNYDLLRWEIISGDWFSDIMPKDNNFQMILGHNMASAGGRYYVQNVSIASGDLWSSVANIAYVNRSDSSPNHDGFSICIGDDAHDVISNKVQFRIETIDNDADDYAEQLKIGSVLYGTYYEMPHSPELSLTMTREMDGVKRIRTKGGVDLVKHQYIKGSMWGDLAAWELNNPVTGDPQNQVLSRVGRRIWSLSFNHLQDSNTCLLYTSPSPRD